MEAELGALPLVDVAEPVEEIQGPAATMQTLLLAQMRQNATLLERLTSKPEDAIQAALGSANASENSGGIKGHIAREAFLRQVSDLTAAAANVQANALVELGLTTPTPGLMREYLEKRAPVMDFRTLAFVGNIASHG